MDIRIRYFASLREKLGVSEEQVDLPHEVKTLGNLQTWLCARGGVWAEALAPGRAVRIAQNQTVCTSSELLKVDSEVAFFPPVTGG
ncbi:molybdopterin converting factor subunit 1 [Ampullimonas aquatilis]|uniref:molybdopterin converting factor subunit 1 n=1 Tax=Ampullimonas aquatilis TaxID=1341549 RepID=UPI003C712179